MYGLAALVKGPPHSTGLPAYRTARSSQQGPVTPTRIGTVVTVWLCFASRFACLGIHSPEAAPLEGWHQRTRWRPGFPSSHPNTAAQALTELPSAGWEKRPRQACARGSSVPGGGVEASCVATCLPVWCLRGLRGTWSSEPREGRMHPRSNAGSAARLSSASGWSVSSVCMLPVRRALLGNTHGRNLHGVRAPAHGTRCAHAAPASVRSVRMQHGMAWQTGSLPGHAHGRAIRWWSPCGSCHALAALTHIHRA
jgi:hypothetical protein